MDDFERCTPPQFFAIHEAWQRHTTQLWQADWERTRQLCTCMLQPHASRQLRPEDVMRFPWEHSPEQDAPLLTPEEREARYRNALDRYGLSQQDPSQ